LHPVIEADSVVTAADRRPEPVIAGRPRRGSIEPAANPSGTIERRTQILLVDDEEDEYILARDLLARAGDPMWSLRWADTFDAGLEMLGDDLVSVCLVDFRLGARTGLDFVREAHTRGSEIPLILMTGFGDRAVDADAIEAGAVDYLDKSELTPAMLERSIRHAIERASTLTKLRESEALRRSADRVDALARLAGDIAHDFNNLVTVMGGCVDLLMEETDPLHPSHEVLVTLRSTADRAADLTRELLDLRGQSDVDVRTIDVGAFTVDLSRIIRQLLGKGIELRLTGVQEPALVRVDPTRLEHAILNLAGNARDATPDGGRLEINVTIEPTTAGSSRAGRRASSGDLVCLTVRDTGHGMDEATLARAFEPYFSTKGRGRGTGLGLASVYGTVQDSGGDIRIESSPGAGTTVRIRLPRVDGTAQRLAGAPAGDA
jgi:signal transduction histidine kinase